MAGMGGETISHDPDVPLAPDLRLHPAAPAPDQGGAAAPLAFGKRLCLPGRAAGGDKGKLYVVLQMAAGEAFTREEGPAVPGFLPGNDPVRRLSGCTAAAAAAETEGLHRSREDADCGTLPELIAALEKKKRRRFHDHSTGY